MALAQLKILILHTLPPASSDAVRLTEEFDLRDAATNIASVLPGSAVVGLRGDLPEVLTALQSHGPDVVFNLCEAPLGRPDLEPHMAAVFEWLRMPFTGSGSDTLALCRRKDRCNAALAAAGVPMPRTGVFPCIVKPIAEDGSAGIYDDSICQNEANLDFALARLGGKAVVQEFLPGREFAVSLWGGNGPEHVSIGETSFLNGLRLLTYTAKWDENSSAYANSPLDYDTAIDPALREAIVLAARGAWQVVEAFGYLRVDIRLDGQGAPRVMDVNPNPEVSPDRGICRAVQEVGWSWQDFVRGQVEWAINSRS